MGRTVLPPLNGLGTLVSSRSTVRGGFPRSVPELLGLDHCCVIVSLEVGKYESCHVVQDCDDFLGSLEIPSEF